MAEAKLEGGCYCGAVRYSATGVPLGSMICHCRSCRRIAGAPVVPWITFPLTKFQFTAGTPAAFASSTPVRRRFCSTCGTQLTYENSASPDEIDVATCTLDDPDEFPPTHHSWLSDDLAWVRFGDGLPTFARSRYEKT